MRQWISMLASTRRIAYGTLALALCSLVVVSGCAQKDPETRAREIAEKIKEQMVNLEQAALDQKVDPAVVKKVQERLTTLHEYMGEPNGQLDSVTVNAIQAFQRAQDLKADGILDKRTLDALEKATPGGKA